MLSHNYHIFKIILKKILSVKYIFFIYYLNIKSDPELVPDSHLVVLPYILSQLTSKVFENILTKYSFKYFSSCKAWKFTVLLTLTLPMSVSGEQVQTPPKFFINYFILRGFRWRTFWLHTSTHIGWCLITFHCFTNENILFWIGQLSDVLYRNFSFIFNYKKHIILLLILCKFFAVT